MEKLAFIHLFYFGIRKKFEKRKEKKEFFSLFLFSIEIELSKLYYCRHPIPAVIQPSAFVAVRSVINADQSLSLAGLQSKSCRTSI